MSPKNGLTKLQALLYLLAMIVVNSVASAGSISQQSLKNALLDRGEIKGSFVQCNQFSTATASSHGTFNHHPNKWVKLNFFSPTRYSSTYYQNGTFNSSIENKQASSQQRQMMELMYHIVNFNFPSLTRRFDFTLDGVTERFTLLLRPLKRLAKLMQSITVQGSHGTVTTVEIRFNDKQAVTVHLLDLATNIQIACE